MSEAHNSGTHKNGADARKAKLEAALRENLRRRKAQARARARKGGPSPEGVESAEKAPHSSPELAKEED